MRTDAQILADSQYENAIQFLDDDRFYGEPIVGGRETYMKLIQDLASALKTYRELFDAQAIGLEMLSFRYNQACQTLREHNLID